MKRILGIVIVVAVILGGIALTRTSKIEYVASEPEVQVVEKEVQVDALDKAVKDAQSAKEEEIETIAKKAYEDAKTQELKKIELEVITSFGEKLDERKVELEKDVKVF